MYCYIIYTTVLYNVTFILYIHYPITKGIELKCTVLYNITVIHNVMVTISIYSVFIFKYFILSNYNIIINKLIFYYSVFYY